MKDVDGSVCMFIGANCYICDKGSIVTIRSFSRSDGICKGITILFNSYYFVVILIMFWVKAIDTIEAYDLPWLYYP